MQYGAKRRGLPFDLSIEAVWRLFLTQGRKCALSGWPIEFAKLGNKHRNEGTASLDRIDSSQGYTLDNVQWVHKAVNMAKQGLTDAAFITLCRAISDYNRV